MSITISQSVSMQTQKKKHTQSESFKVNIKIQNVQSQWKVVGEVEDDTCNGKISDAIANIRALKSNVINTQEFGGFLILINFFLLYEYYFV